MTGSKINRPIILLAVFWAGCAALYPILPEQIPIHWDMYGNINGYANKVTGALLLPLMPLGIYLLMKILPKIDPKKANYALFQNAYERISRILAVIFAIFSAVPLLAALGLPIHVELIIRSGAAILFILLGNYMGQIRPNFFIGIRTPWTLSNDMVWQKTHRFAGKAMVIGGLLGLISCFVPAAGIVLYFTAIFAPMVLAVIYSYILYKKTK